MKNERGHFYVPVFLKLPFCRERRGARNRTLGSEPHPPRHGDHGDEGVKNRFETVVVCGGNRLSFAARSKGHARPGLERGRFKGVGVAGGGGSGGRWPTAVRALPLSPSGRKKREMTSFDDASNLQLSPTKCDFGGKKKAADWLTSLHLSRYLSLQGCNAK